MVVRQLGTGTGFLRWGLHSPTRAQPLPRPFLAGDCLVAPAAEEGTVIYGALTAGRGEGGAKWALSSQTIYLPVLCTHS